MIGSRAKTRKGIVAKKKEGVDGVGEENDGNAMRKEGWRIRNGQAEG
jgi:hypothetical protein